MSSRRISIVTPSLNRARLLESAIVSVIDQGYPDYEHIIVDGGSADQTEQTVRRYPRTKFVTGPDRGMYDALNRGIGMASGEIVGFLNSDDLYAEKSFHEMARAFDDPDVMAVAGRAIVFTELPDGSIRIIERYSPGLMSLIESSTIGSNFFNAWFFRRTTFELIGNFNADFRIAGDREFMLRFALNHLKYQAIHALVYKYRSHEGSVTFHKDRDRRESSAVEHVSMTGGYLSDGAVTGAARRLVIRLRTKETVELAARSLWRLDFRAFLEYVLEGSRYDPGWPVKFLQFSVNRAIARLRPGGRH